MPAFEVEWRRCGRDAIKKLILRAERTCVSLTPGAGSQDEEHRKSDMNITAEL